MMVVVGPAWGACGSSASSSVTPRVLTPGSRCLRPYAACGPGKAINRPPIQHTLMRALAHGTEPPIGASRDPEEA